MRIALFGGSFDPPHRGHLAIARAAADRFELDRVLFAPAGRQPLKRDGATASFPERLQMVTLACAADRRFLPSAIDAPHPDGAPNYTIDVLETLARENAGSTLFSLAGADSFHTLAEWREPRRLLAVAEWIVVSRPGYVIADPRGLRLTKAERQRVHALDTVHDEAAATGLRERLATGDPCRDVLPAAVSEYILTRGLYRHSRMQSAQESPDPVR